MTQPTRLGFNLLFFGIAAVALGGLAWFLQQNHFVNDMALRRWATLLEVLDSPRIRPEYLGLLYPHGTFLALAPFHYLGPLDSAMAPTLVSVLFGAGLLALWSHHLQRAGQPPVFRILLVGLVVLHPAFLWGATSGSMGAISLGCFYLLYTAALRLIIRDDIHSFIVFGVLLAAFFFVEGASLYLSLALVPLLPLLAPRHILMSAPLSTFVILATPLLVVAFGWFYYNWLFFGTPLAFLQEAHTQLQGSAVEALPWLRIYGDQCLLPGLWTLGLTLAAFPAMVLLLGGLRQDSQRLVTALVLLFHPVVAVCLATEDRFLRHPLELVALVLAGIMAELAYLGPRPARARQGVVALLALGLFGGWAGFLLYPTPTMEAWRGAFLKPVTAPDHAGEIALGRWLGRHRGPTLLDDASGYRAIAARGDARGLIVPFEDRFQIELRLRQPTVEQVALPDPDSMVGLGDALNRRWPDFYQNGKPGYRLVYDYGGWRVWKRDA
ncbi:hypothetical protein [Thiohalorhabdus methylotrophus]|uniref:DUF2079 domain-containing protein n=1 Tax=Thiohalorhabdus methylotrophus TaxID=3242694 RepID=A0ABV4TQI0_9GAMM